MRVTLAVCACLIVAVVLPLAGCISKGMQEDKKSDEGKSKIRIEREKLLVELKEKQNRMGYDDSMKMTFRYEADILKNFLDGEDFYYEENYTEAVIRFEEAMEMIKTVPSVTKKVRVLYDEAKSYIRKANRKTKPR
ncbi:MAG: hypothetical protein E3J72_08210 [Planctomycetota bacterium]|nr:MAG: hypothetical protein E3J72_08210 [Planctomycetota bacterium]